jgi:hypothetical protein
MPPQRFTRLQAALRPQTKFSTGRFSDLILLPMMMRALMGEGAKERAANCLPSCANASFFPRLVK